jgi:hypothetical protein
MKKLLLLTPFLLLNTVAHAAEPATPAPVPAPVSGNWLDERGLLTIDGLIAALDAKVTPEQRAELEKALNERNNAVAAANAKLSATLKKTFAADDTKMATDAKDATRLDRLRRLQPSRYQELMRRKADEEKGKTEPK